MAKKIRKTNTTNNQWTNFLFRVFYKQDLYPLSLYRSFVLSSFVEFHLDLFLWSVIVQRECQFLYKITYLCEISITKIHNKNSFCRTTAWSTQIILTNTRGFFCEKQNNEDANNTHSRTAKERIFVFRQNFTLLRVT